MAIEVFSPDVAIEYIPEYGKNRESDKPCIVKLRYVPFVKSQEYSRLIAARLGQGAPREKVTEVSQAVQKRQFFDNVVSTSGFFVDGKEITTVEGLWEHAPSELVHEIVTAMESALKLKEGLRVHA
ncbi:MAG: hypothetical protein QY316_06350 [Thermodesulfobacteriota bacterium]|nr:MAG: hypothetical protein QY316_06350 [Thermodesulfobacteriota bacterium]